MTTRRARDRESARWQRRRVAGYAVRVTMAVVPFMLAVASIGVLSRVVPRPAEGGVLLVGWYLAICAVSWFVLWRAQRLLAGLLPLAALLEMSLLFPERAPSRLRMARRVASRRDLEVMLDRRGGGRRESTQEAAERILALVSALAVHDRATRGHSERVRVLSDLIAVRLNLSERDRDRLRWAALLHDIGKLRVPAVLLNKAGRPNAREWEVLHEHPGYGAVLAAPLLEWLEGWGDVIVQHHEKWDGGGYPRGLAGEQICLGARIVAVADAFDVMTAARAYKRPVGRVNALRELVACSGAHFDPAIVRAFITTPQRKLLLAMGPLSWISGLPLVGQAPATLATTFTAQTTAVTAALGAVAVTGAAAVSPVTLHVSTASGTTSTGHRRQVAPVHPSSKASPGASRSSRTPPAVLPTSVPTSVPASASAGSTSPPDAVPSGRPTTGKGGAASGRAASGKAARGKAAPGKAPPGTPRP